MHPGISTACLYPMESEEALKLLISYGYRHFEFFINSQGEMKREFLAEFKALLDNSGSTVKSLHPFTSFMESMLFFSEYERRFIDGLEFYKNYFEAANRLGAELLILHGQGMGRDGRYILTDEEYCRRFLCISQLAKTFGVTLCQENVHRHRSGSLRFIETMKKELGDEVSFVFDVKQSLLCGEDPATMISAMGRGLRHVHLSDSKKGASCLLPGAGTFDLPGLVRVLKETGYSGSVITEVYSNSYSERKEIETARFFAEKLVMP